MTANSLDVSALATTIMAEQSPLPECEYSVRRATANGPLVRSAQVGDTVYHRWQCTGNGKTRARSFTEHPISDAYGMLVHSCHVEDAGGRKTSIVDDNG